MKITNREIIQNGERELMDAITGDLDWGVMEDIFRKEYGLSIGEDVVYKNGDIVIHDNQIVYRLDFNVNVTLSVLVDRTGSCLSLTSSGDVNKSEKADEDMRSDGKTEISLTELDSGSIADSNKVLINQPSMASLNDDTVDDEDDEAAGSYLADEAQ